MKPKFIISKKDNIIMWTALNEASVEFIINKGIEPDSDYVLMFDDSDIDYSFTFCYDFNFDDTNGSTAIPTFNVNKAKELLFEKMRTKRNKLFPELDIQYMRALEIGNQPLIEEIVAKKELLRNVTNINFSDVTTPNDVKSKWPSDILGTSPF